MQTHNNAVFKMREEMRFGQKESAGEEIYDGYEKYLGNRAVTG